MGFKLHILALILVSLLLQTARAQDAAMTSSASVTLDTLAACQSLHHLAALDYNLRNHGSSAGASDALDQISTRLRQIDSVNPAALFPVKPDDKQETKRTNLSLYLSNLRRLLSQGTQSGPALALIRPEGLDDTLTSLTNYWSCDQIGSDLTYPNMSEAEGGFLSGGGPRALSDRVPEVSPPADYMHTAGQDLSSNANSRHLSKNPIRLLFEDNRHYLILLGVLIFIGGTYTIFRRLKRFEARETRRVLNRLIQVRLGDQTHDFYLVDLSRNGAKLNHPGTIRSETTVHIGLLENWHVGQIKWHNDLYAGVLFKTPLDEETFNENIVTP